MDEANIAIARGMIEDVIKQDGLDVQGQFDIRSAWFSGLLTGNTFSRAEESTLMDYERAVDLTILPLEDYTRMTGERPTLAPDEAYFCCPRMAYTQPDIRIGELTYQIKGPAAKLRRLRRTAQTSRRRSISSSRILTQR